MKLLTLNFLTCAIKTCKTNPASFPLHPRDAELEIVEADVNLAFLKNILPRLMWNELRGICSEVREGPQKIAKTKKKGRFKNLRNEG
jgi:multifunctional methyltransferase subunit TRM112